MSRRQASTFSRNNQRGHQKPGDPRVQAIRMCGNDWRRALLLLRESRQPDIKEFNATIDACARARKPSEAIGLLDDLPNLGLKPNHATFNGIMKAYANTGGWKSTLRVLDRMVEEGVMPNEFNMNTAISACGKARQWKMALELFNSMEGRGV
eukprot:CAMPEP_0172592480 /NCGR_PEP_ID=MMETSP1068-20121228/11460_1 /TAXON_ID=35684 /ORGANISM="Pseudopedinella elastica, Strain CCMP716" /LENGTH=151 /DNA_ID=CAMNT_0013389485 /DNA_START=132 /DNA_END=583 /DNA_ORIENTATION=+